jgi:eukaryotic-like serine/threonine-protein kinase
MNSASSCPSVEELRAFALGEILEPKLSLLAKHVEGCADCLAKLDQIRAEDAVSEALPAQDSTYPPPHNPMVEELIPRLAALRARFAAGDGAEALQTALTEESDNRHGFESRDPGDRPELRPPVVSGYEIFEELGRGGMGVVYRARQVKLNRLAALKMILHGVHAGAQHLARFRTEARAAASLEHPNVVHIYEVGEHDGRPFLALEYVDGGTLARKLAGTPLAPQAAAALVETLAGAVHAAHAKGIIHRDLKPANVLLTGDGIPKISDFGLAKRLLAEPDASALAGPTESGVIFGTPSYMAPEQATGTPGSTGPATDVYALGGILYEALTGRPPFKAATPLDTLEQVRSQEPVRPDQLQPGLPRDLQTICLKCLEKEPAKRYASALELAEDLRRFLNGEPIRARPVGRSERLRKWVRRKTALAALLALASLSAVTLVAGVFGHNVRLQAALEEAQKNRERADQNLARARQAVDEYCTHVADDPRLKREDQRALRKKLLETAIPFYEEFVRQKADDPSLLADQGRALLRLALLRRELGEHQSALADAEMATGIFMNLTGVHPEEPDYAAELGKCRRTEGLLLVDLGQRDKAQDALRQAIDVQERLGAGQPGRAEDRSELAASYHKLGDLLSDRGANEEARVEYQKAVGLLEPLAASDLALPQYCADLASARISFGAVLLFLGREEDSRSEFQKAIDMQQRLVAKHPFESYYRVNLAKSRNNLGSLLAMLGKSEPAAEEFRQAIGLQITLAVENPSAAEYRYDLARSRINLGSVLLNLGRWEEARAEYRKAMELCQRLAADFPAVQDYAVYLAWVMGNYGHLERDSGQPQDSLAWFDKALSGLDQVLAKDPRLAFARANQQEFTAGKALALARLGRRAEALKVAVPLADDKELADDALYYTACAFAVCSKRDPSKPMSGQQHAERALALLRHAATAGYFANPEKLSKLGTDKDLDPLRRRADFTRFLHDLQSLAGKPK